MGHLHARAEMPAAVNFSSCEKTPLFDWFRAVSRDCQNLLILALPFGDFCLAKILILSLCDECLACPGRNAARLPL